MVSLDVLSSLNDIYPAFGLLQVLYQFGPTAMQVTSTVMSDFVSVTFQMLFIFTCFGWKVQIFTMICSKGLNLKLPFGIYRWQFTLKRKDPVAHSVQIPDCKFYPNDIWRLCRRIGPAPRFTSFFMCDHHPSRCNGCPYGLIEFPFPCVLWANFTWNIADGNVDYGGKEIFLLEVTILSSKLVFGNASYCWSSNLH